MKVRKFPTEQERFCSVNSWPGLSLEVNGKVATGASFVFLKFARGKPNLDPSMNALIDKFNVLEAELVHDELYPRRWGK